MSDLAKCELCGEPMPKGEEMFKYHGYSGPCPKPPTVRREGADIQIQEWKDRNTDLQRQLEQSREQAKFWNDRSQHYQARSEEYIALSKKFEELYEQARQNEAQEKCGHARRFHRIEYCNDHSAPGHCPNCVTKCSECERIAALEAQVGGHKLALKSAQMGYEAAEKQVEALRSFLEETWIDLHVAWHYNKDNIYNCSMPRCQAIKAKLKALQQTQPGEGEA